MDHGQRQALPNAPGDQQPEERHTYEEVAQVIEYPLLHPAFSDEDVIRGCQLARDYRFAAILVRPTDVELAQRYLGPDTALASPVGFPDGMSTTAAKLYEGRDLLRRGVKEIEFTLNIGKLLGRQFQYVEMELLQMAKSCLESGAKFKVDLGARFLDRDLKIIALKICKRVEAHFVSIEASPDDLVLLAPLLKDRISVKIATNVPSLSEVLALRAAGASRMVSRNAGPILDEWKEKLKAQQELESGASPVT